MKKSISIYKLVCTADQLWGPESFSSIKLMLNLSNLPPTPQYESLLLSLLIQVRPKHSAEKALKIKKILQKPYWCIQWLLRCMAATLRRLYYANTAVRCSLPELWMANSLEWPLFLTLRAILDVLYKSRISFIYVHRSVFELSFLNSNKCQTST